MGSEDMSLKKNESCWSLLLKIVIIVTLIVLVIMFIFILRSDYTPRSDVEGMNFLFDVVLKAPLTFLSVSLPIVVVITVMIRMLQTERQIQLTMIQNTTTNFFMHRREFYDFCDKLELEYCFKIDSQKAYAAIFPDNNPQECVSLTGKKLVFDEIDQELHTLPDRLKATFPNYSGLKDKANRSELLQYIQQALGMINYSAEKLGITVPYDSAFRVEIKEFEKVGNTIHIPVPIPSLQEYLQMVQRIEIDLAKFAHIKLHTTPVDVLAMPGISDLSPVNTRFEQGVMLTSYPPIIYFPLIQHQNTHISEIEGKDLIISAKGASLRIPKSMFYEV